MIILPPTDTGVDEAVRILQRGGVIIHATETCYGIACDLRSMDALKRLFDAKQRPYTQVVSALMADEEMTKRYLHVSPRAQELMDAHLPGPLTIILPSKEEGTEKIAVCPAPTPPSTIGLRISSHPLASLLVHRFGFPLATTSANLHGKDNPYSLADVLAQYGEHPPLDAFIDSGELPHVPPSTVIALQGEEIVVHRQGTTRVV
jgi:L-threonylcarbamoyladenylate synthase